MKIKVLNFTAIAVLLFFVACSNENDLPETNFEFESGRSLSLTASMPDEQPSTRVGLTQEGLDIATSWELNDEIMLAYVQGSNKGTTIVTVDSISNNGKKAHFEIPIPANASGQFTLYGVYGSQGIDLTGSNPVANLPANPGSAGTLNSVEERLDAMLYFEHSMQTTDTEASVSFNQIGSLFAISFNGVTQNTINFITQQLISEVRIVGVVGPENDENWAFNNGTGGQGFDLVTKEFEDVSTAGNYISFSTQGSSLVIGETTTLWGWYPPLPNKAWPELSVELRTLDGTVVLSSSNTKAVRATAPTAGKTYHFYTSFTNDIELNFTNPY